MDGILLLFLGGIPSAVWAPEFQFSLIDLTLFLKKFLVFHGYREKHVGTIFNEPRKNGAIF